MIDEKTDAALPAELAEDDLDRAVGGRAPVPQKGGDPEDGGE